MAQLVEYDLAKVGVAGSSPVSRSERRSGVGWVFFFLCKNKGKGVEMRIDKKYKGIMFIVMSAFCFALMNVFVRLSGDLPSVQKSFFRNFIAFIIAAATMGKQHIWYSGSVK